MTRPDISVVITAHREGMLAGISAQSADAAIGLARDDGITCEVIVVLDRSDQLTADTLRTYFGDRARIVESDIGDPGLARNQGILHATGDHACFLDADDLWSENWLVEAYRFAGRHKEVIAHSCCNVTFGDSRVVWWHADSESALCDPEYLDWMNYWDALAFARTDIFRAYPYRANDLAAGYGHEDWHWNKLTMLSGVSHRPVPGTIHFKRRRGGSQSDLVDRSGSIPWPIHSRRTS